MTSRVLGALAQDGTLTYDGLSSTLSVPRQTIAREIQRFRESGLIRRVGSARRGVWLMEKDAERRG
ncbi:MAG: helix-turn-helix domain-containing protein [Bifidobacteriaceae bacterium]|nr:helix-turn-helix domain-containing protein [Bifidobacteriaceae bacterium]